MKKKKSTVGKVLRAILVVLIVIIVAAAVFVKSKLDLIDYDRGGLSQYFHVVIDEVEELVDISGLRQVDELKLPEGDAVTDKNVLNILVLGTDERTLEFSDAARADAIMLVSFNFAEGTGRLVSLERGMGVPILGGEYEGQYDWLTHCFRYGGADLMLKEVQECFNVDVDRYVRINFNALIKVIDAVGGVDLDLTQAEANYINTEEYNVYVGDSGTSVQYVQAGLNHVNGATALCYARCRHIDSDWQRIERQRKLVQAFTDAIKSADLATLNTLCDEILPMIRTNFTQLEIAQLMLKAPGMLGVQFEQMTIPVEGTYGGMTVMGGRGSFAPDFEENAKILQDFLYGTD